MMKDVDGLSIHVDILIYHCLVQFYYMRDNNIVLRQINETIPSEFVPIKAFILIFILE